MTSLALVIVTFNLLDLLFECLNSIMTGNFIPKKVYIVNNASTDNTSAILNKCKHKWGGRIECIELSRNLGGAGGFEIGTRIAYRDGVTWIGLLDDDVLLDQNCLQEILNHAEKGIKCMVAVRESKNGKLAEYSALKLDYKNPFRLNPKLETVASAYTCRNDLPSELEICSGSFEGFFLRRDVIEKIGFPKREFFIFGDDTDYSLRVRRSGIKIFAIRDARIVRQIPFQRYKESQKKTYYRWRNFFVLHFLYGENFAVRMKPYVFAFVLNFLNIFKHQKLDFFSILADAHSLVDQIRTENRSNIDLTGPK